jgi:hypothetical protein
LVKAERRGISPDKVAEFVNIAEAKTYPQTRALNNAFWWGGGLAAVGILGKAVLNINPEWTAEHITIPIHPHAHNFFNSIWGDLFNANVPNNALAHIAQASQDLGKVIGVTGGLSTLISEKIKNSLDVGGRSANILAYKASLDRLEEDGIPTAVNGVEATWELPERSTLDLTYDGDTGAEEMAIKLGSRHIIMQASKPKTVTAENPQWLMFDHTDEARFSDNFHKALKGVKFDGGEVLLRPSNAKNMMYSGNKGLDVTAETIVRSFKQVKEDLPDKPVRVIVSKRVTQTNLNSQFQNGETQLLDTQNGLITDEIPAECIIDLSERATQKVILYAQLHGKGIIDFNEGVEEEGKDIYTTVFNGYLADTKYVGDPAAGHTQVIYKTADIDAYNAVVAQGKLNLKPNQVVIFQNKYDADRVRNLIDEKLKPENDPNCGLSKEQIIVGSEMEEEILTEFTNAQ